MVSKKHWKRSFDNNMRLEHISDYNVTFHDIDKRVPCQQTFSE